MNRDIAQRLVHEEIDGWDQSITDARTRLGYDPAWLTSEAIQWDGTRPEPQFQSWFARNKRAVTEALTAAMRDLGLPEEGFGRYWRACFFSPYRDGDYTTIVERNPQFGQSGVRRAYPPVASMLSVTLTVSPAGSRLTISGPTSFVTDATLREASTRALRLVEQAGDREHSLLLRRRSRAGQIARHTRANPQRERAFALEDAGTPINEIVRELEREPTNHKPPARSTVQRWLRQRRERSDRRP
jgi:hypothetical protein